MLHGLLLPLKCSPSNPPREWYERLKKSHLCRSDVKLYIGVDADDRLWQEEHRAYFTVLHPNFVEVMSPDDQPQGAVCAVWNRLAKRAVEDGVDGALVLFGDDVTYLCTDRHWLTLIADQLARSPLRLFHPIDKTDKSVCTFPVVSAQHVLLFGELFPPCFRNQGADPFLHELYRRADCVEVLTKVEVDNARGGPRKGWPGRDERPNPAYTPVTVSWNEEMMNEWAEKLASQLKDPPKVGSIDVLVPTYRCDANILRKIKSAVDSEPRAKLIIQVDDPESVHLQEVLSMEAHNTRVRVNRNNIGAPCTRNQLLKEATASVVLFLDDDVFPSPAVVEKYLAAMLCPSGRRHCGLVGRVIFPPSRDVWHEATRMSWITVAFDWPNDSFPDDLVPWGVTASLCLWREYAVDFDVQYAKTGGGEDLDFCLRVSEKAGLKWGKASSSEVYHPFWKREPGATGLLNYLRHFFKWTQGDGLLLDRYPEHVYLNFPNVIEISPPVLFGCGMLKFLLFWVVELALEGYYAWISPHAYHLNTIDRVFAAMLSGVVKNVVDFGHAFYFLRRGRLMMLCSRFDWFCGMTDGVRRGERRKFFFRWAFWMMAIFMLP